MALRSKRIGLLDAAAALVWMWSAALADEPLCDWRGVSLFALEWLDGPLLVFHGAPSLPGNVYVCSAPLPRSCQSARVTDDEELAVRTPASFVPLELFICKWTRDRLWLESIRKPNLAESCYALSEGGGFKPKQGASFLRM